MNYTVTDTARYCADIGMFAIDRGIPDSCVHQTEFCRTKCFNDKLYKAYPNMRVKDTKNNIAWSALDTAAAADFSRSLDRKRHQTERVRLMTRGEAFKDYSDIERVRALADASPERIYWIPTRSWRAPLLWARVQQLGRECSNLRILASIDPSNTEQEVADLESAGVSTMYFGDDEALTTTTGARRFKCPKTWGHVKGACAVCKRGCFRNDKPVHVHLKQH